VSLTAHERETVITFSDGDNTAYIYTAMRTVITKLKKNPAAKLVEKGVHNGSVWARFELPANLVSFRSVRVRRELTDAQRQELADRLRGIRQEAVSAV
jgi:hypothetical protein